MDLKVCTLLVYKVWLEKNRTGYVQDTRLESQGQTPHSWDARLPPLPPAAAQSSSSTFFKLIVFSQSVRKMVGVLIEQRMNVKFLLKLCKPATELFLC